MCDNKIDVFIYMVGYLNGVIKEVIIFCVVKLVFVMGFEIEKIVVNNFYYVYSVVLVGMYSGID